MIEQTLRKAMAVWHSRHQIGREPGFHASQSRFCIKKVILEAVFPKDKKPLSLETENVFAIGNLYHDWFDDILRVYSRETADILWIQPFRLKSFIYEMSQVFKDNAILGEDYNGVSPAVFGTPDGIIIDGGNISLLVPDYKTSNARAFNYKAKGSRSATHQAQLGTYLSPLLRILRQLGITTEIEEASIVYINKENADLVVHSYDVDLSISMAKQYWEDVAKQYSDFHKSGGTLFPPANPPEKWMCDYCSMFNSKQECLQCTDLETFKNSRITQGELL